ncbi:MAG: hypothetical protein QXR45_08320 [Candidatus Bathyarchaeia archaeon]
MLSLVFTLPVKALESTGSVKVSDPEGDLFIDYCNDDGYFLMRDITSLNVTWDSSILTIILTVATLTNTTAAWNNTGFAITIGNGTDGNEWWPQWSSTRFNQTTAAKGNWMYTILVQNVTSESGLAYSYVCDVGWRYTPFSDLGITVEIPTTPANTIIVKVPWEAIGGFDAYGDEFYVNAGSFYCYAYGPAATGDILTKYLDHVGAESDRIIVPQPGWGHDPDGYDKYEVIIGNYIIVPEFQMIWLICLLFIVATLPILAGKKFRKQ